MLNGAGQELLHPPLGPVLARRAVAACRDCLRERLHLARPMKTELRSVIARYPVGSAVIMN